MAKKPKTTTQIEKIEKEFTIPLREKCRVVPKYKKTNKAIKTIKEFLVRHMKVYDRDLRKIKIDKYLNEAVWSRGIKNPPIKIRVKAIKEPDTGIIRVELAELPEKLRFKKIREEKLESSALEAMEKKKKKLGPKPPEEKPKEPEKGKTEEEKKEEKEKAEAGAEVTKKLEKDAAKQLKHQAGGKTKQPKRQIRKSLEK